MTHDNHDMEDVLVASCGIDCNQEQLINRGQYEDLTPQSSSLFDQCVSL